MQNFQEVLAGIDVEPLLSQIDQHPEFWNLDDSWTKDKRGSPIYNEDNIVLRFNNTQPLEEWNRPSFTVLGEAQKIIFKLMYAIPGEFLGKVIITRLLPGQVIKPHIDMMPPGIKPIFQRFQIPLAVRPGAVFYCGDETLWMEPGRAYWFNNQLLHSVVNDSSENRISMLTDIRPFIPFNPLHFKRSA